MKIIKNRLAYELAKAKFGDNAFVGRKAKEFFVGIEFCRLGLMRINWIVGTGKTWEAALLAAGIALPQEEVVGLPSISMLADHDPIDTDAKEPIE